MISTHENGAPSRLLLRMQPLSAAAKTSGPTIAPCESRISIALRLRMHAAAFRHSRASQEAPVRINHSNASSRPMRMATTHTSIGGKNDIA